MMNRSPDIQIALHAELHFFLDIDPTFTGDVSRDLAAVGYHVCSINQILLDALPNNLSKNLLKQIVLLLSLFTILSEG